MAGPPSVTWSAGNTLTAANLNTNFADVGTSLANIGNDQMSDDAGLTSDKLLDKYAPVVVTVPLVPYAGHDNSTADDTIVTPQPVNTPSNTASPGQEIYRFYPELDTNRRSYLVSVTLSAAAVTQTSTAWPMVWVTLNSTVMGGGGRSIENTSVYRLQNNSPIFQAPLAPVGPTDYIAFGLGRSDSSGVPLIRGLVATVTFKSEITS